MIRSTTGAFAVACAVICLTAAGCSSGFNRGRLESELKNGSYEVRVEPTPHTVTADDINKARERRGQLRFPFRLAIRLLGDNQAAGFRWNQQDRDLVGEWERTLKNRGVISDLVVMNDATRRGDSPEQIRLAAAEHGADAVLLLRAANDVDEYVNPFATFYLTIIGLWMAPGSHIDALVMLDGTVIDVGNGFLYAAVQSEGEGSTFGPKAIIERRDAIDQAKTVALKELGATLTDELTGLR